MAEPKTPAERVLTYLGVTLSGAAVAWFVTWGAVVASADPPTSRPFWIAATWVAAALFVIGLGFVAVGEGGRIRRPTWETFGLAKVDWETHGATISDAEASIAEIAKKLEPTSPEPPEQRVYVGPSVTPEYLMELGKDLLHIHAAKLHDDYIGKWMRVTRPLRDVGPWVSWGGPKGGFPVYFAHDDTEAGVVAIFNDPSLLDRLSVLRQGDQVSLVGRIRSLELVVTLEQCELVEEAMNS